MKAIYSYPLIFILLVGCVFASSQTEIFCDLHNAKAFYDRTEKRNGKCFRIYSHPVWKDGERYTHTLTTTVPCD
jgi:hypothetical protein